MFFLSDADPEIPPHTLKIPETASSRHRCAVADYSHLSPEIVGICTRVHPPVPVENIKEI